MIPTAYLMSRQMILSLFVKDLVELVQPNSTIALLVHELRREADNATGQELDDIHQTIDEIDRRRIAASIRWLWSTGADSYTNGLVLRASHRSNDTTIKTWNFHDLVTLVVIADNDQIVTDAYAVSLSKDSEPPLDLWTATLSEDAKMCDRLEEVKDLVPSLKRRRYASEITTMPFVRAETLQVIDRDLSVSPACRALRF
jgi:hypothetical protein